MKYLLLLSGKINCGKNQYAKFLQEEFEKHGLKVKQDLYAGDLKQFASEDFTTLGHTLFNKVQEIKASFQMFTDIRYGIPPAVFDNVNTLLDGLTFTEENFWEDKTDITRVLLQLYGTEIARKRFDDQFWIKSLAKRVNEDENDVIIITDARFPNELEDIRDYVNNRRVIPIRIEREIDRNQLHGEHSSEKALDDYQWWEWIVDNNGTLEDLKASSEVVVEDILSENS